ncbi:hypothetical protein BGX21_007948 [Mortierella sp. AD011]|nr:hypothetical protein BGX20_008431 [Mortierella sp. AD010]KAF9398322.1 hypothetical protein BGX21_007948 [Mortierella sp. AD011]
MERANETSTTSLNSDPFTPSAARNAADNCTDDVFICSRETSGNSAHADDSDESDGSRKHNQSHIAAGSSSDRSKNKGTTKSNTNDVTTKDNTIIGSGNTSNTSEYSIFTNSLRAAAPSPMIKSRSAIASERVKYMTPKWVSRRTSKAPLRNPLLPDLPSTSADNTTKSVHKRQASLAPASSLGFLSTSRYDLSLPISEESQSSSVDPEADQSSILMPPPPPPPPPRSVRPLKTPKQDQHRRKHRRRHNMSALMSTSRPRSQFVVGERRNVTSTPDFNENRHSRDNISSIDSGHNDRETRCEVALGIGESSVRSKSRPGKGAIVYRLPSISK